MSLLHFALPCLLGLLHATAVVVLGDTSPHPTVTSVATIDSTYPVSANILQTRTVASATPEGDSDQEVEPILSLHCLDDGRMLLICESGHQGATSFHWTLDENYLQETHAIVTYNNNNTIILQRGVHGNMMCKVRGHIKDFASSPIKLACEGDTSSSWLFYSIILAASGGGAFLLSMVVLSITCYCCRRRSRHLSLYQEDIEMGSVFVDLEKKLSTEEVKAVEETTLIVKTSPKDAPEEDGFKFPNPPGLDHPLSEGDGNDATEERLGSCDAGSGSDGSNGEDPNNRMTEDESNGCLEN